MDAYTLTLYDDALNQGQKKQIVKNDAVKHWKE